MKYTALLTLALGLFHLGFTQEDSTQVEEEFDFSDFVLTEAPAKSFCNNKVLGQSPTALISVYYDFQSQNTLSSGPINQNPAFPEEEATINANHGFGILGNFPVLSRNNILINIGVEYSEQYYAFDDGAYSNPLTRNLQTSPLRRTAVTATVFKPLNEKRFLLGFVGGSLNGDYDFGQYDFSKTRVPIAAIYGFKPSDNLMWGIGGVRTYLGGALNYLPVVYYYHTFKNPKWGVEAVVPSRVAVRYRANSKTILNGGFTLTGASYHLSRFRDFEAEYYAENGQEYDDTLEDNVELRRSELRVGVGMQRALSDFIWMNLQAGARLNWSYNTDEGDFFRGFDSEGYYMENELSTPLFVRLYISFVSP